MAYAQSTDIADRLGRELDESEARIVEIRLDDVEAIIKTRVPDLDDKIAEGKMNSRLVEMVEAEAILRLIRNPEGFTQETDGNYSYSIDSRVASGRLTLLPDEWAMLGVRSGVTVFAPKITLPDGSCKPCNPNYDFETGIDYPPYTPPSEHEPHEAVWA